MPNHCDNDLYVRGPASIRQAFKAAAQYVDGRRGAVDALSFVSLHPRPEILEGTRSPPLLAAILTANPERSQRYLDNPKTNPQGALTAAELLVDLGMPREALAYGQLTMDITHNPALVTSVDQALRAHAETGYLDWHAWSMAHWGTKWGVYDSTLKYEKSTSTKYGFYSAWSPPIAGFDKIASDWPDLKFALRYFEAGGGFKGHADWAAGERTSEGSEFYRGSRGG